MARTRALWGRVGAALVVGGALCASSSPAASVPPPSYYGTNVQPLFEKGFVAPTGWNALIADMSADGWQVARADAAWAWVERTAPVKGVHTYTWDPPTDPAHSMDGLVSLLASNHVRMLAVLAIAPSWAGAGHEELTAAHDGDFVAYAAAFAARYGAGGTFWLQHPQLPYLPVQQFEVWTEGNSTNFWTGQPDPAEYVNVLEPLHAAVHSVDPDAQVLASVGWQGAPAFVAALYADGVKGSIDAVGFHPYGQDVPSTVGLVQQMHATLVAAGDPGLPIDDTEVGVPAPTPAADATRASMLTLSGDALARSDCNAQSFDVYALTSSGTGAEPINEGYMGILDHVTGAPDITGQALIAASQRWQADPTSGLILCAGTTTPPSTLLPLGLDLTHTSPTCVSATITYEGNPLQSAQIILRTADGRVDPATTTPAGQVQMCLQNGPPITSFTVDAEISSPVTTASLTSPDIGESATYSCPVSVSAPTAACPLIAPAPGATTTTGGSAPPPVSGNATTTTTTTTSTTSSTSSTSAHGSGSGGDSGASGRGGSSQTSALRHYAGVPPLKGCRLQLALTGSRAGRTALHTRLTCAHATPPATRVHVALTRRGHRRASAAATVTLAKGRWVAFTLTGVPRAGDRLSAAAPANATAGVPAVAVAFVVAARRG